MTAAMIKEALALTGGGRAVAMPLSNWPIIDETEERWMLEVLRSGKWNWLGEHEREFCRAYAEFIGARHCLCLSSGTAALQCALQAVGVEPGHEVIVPALTWVATAQAALDIGADVVLVDIDPETLCIDPESVRQSINPRTKAILPVHLYGCMCDMDAIMEIARDHDLKVVEDVAHQHGSQWRGIGAGALADAGGFSFELSKALTCGEGGAITCDDAEVYEIAFALKQVGWTPKDVESDPLGEKGLQPGRRYGHNYRITEMQACLLRGGLTRLSEQTAKREENARYLADKLSGMGGPMRIARRDPRVTRQAYYCLTLHVDPEQLDGLTRDQYLKALQAEWIPVGGTYEPVYRNGLLNLYDRTSPIPFRDRNTVQNYAELRLPNTERAVAETGVTLSHVQLLGDREYMDQILDGISKVNDHLDDVKRHFERQGDQ
jgi:L-glutamine:2-deoxy-scyllo-inosose/3-amino-2,3-dideoxy-scyllo-inosose aminotransferase